MLTLLEIHSAVASAPPPQLPVTTDPTAMEVEEAPAPAADTTDTTPADPNSGGSFLKAVLSGMEQRSEAAEVPVSASGVPVSVALKTMQAVQKSQEATDLHEALHEYTLFPRPSSTKDIAKLAGLVNRLIAIIAKAGLEKGGTGTTCKDAWTIFTLTTLLRRYHAKAPEAKAQVLALLTNDTSNTTGTGTGTGTGRIKPDAVGDGERLIFYVTFLTLHRFWQLHKPANDDTDTTGHQAQRVLKTEEQKQAQLAYQAVGAMIRLAAKIGGTRDLCAIMEHLTMATLVQAKFVLVPPIVLATGAMMEVTVDPPETFADKLVPAVQDFAIQNNHTNELLELALRLAAQQLDQDLHLINKSKHADDDNPNQGEHQEILSTIHVMIPHNQRGSNTRASWQRKLANSLAEILIWQRTETAAKTDSRFVRAMDALKALPDIIHKGNIEKGQALIQQLQTSIRKHRQLLNNHARQQGFLVASSYQIDKTSITFKMIRRAKVGDLKVLELLARKHGDARTLRLIAKRHLDPDKAIPMESIQELISNWVGIGGDDDKDDELAAIELQLQASMVQATLDKLRCPETDRPVLVTCVGADRDNIVCAILVAASLENSRLSLAGEVHDVSTTGNCIDLLNQVLVQSKFLVDGEQGFMAVEEILNNNLRKEDKSKEDVIVLSSRDLELDEHVLKELQERDITLRVHATSKLVAAPTGTVQLSLNTTIYDRIKARQPLTLGVVLDCTGSMGGEIEGCKKGALKLISTFQELAPVTAVNFMGYWDPVNVSTDPQPKSTGYLNTTNRHHPENMTALTEFVNTQLVCQGGGDEPEDIPQALEKFIDDMKTAGLSADKGVHMLFFIADAGYRSNEEHRMRAALEILKKLGVVLVMCKVRGGGSIQTLVDRSKECFQEDGQLILLGGVGQLASIAASVTESIRASLFQSSNVVSVTASVGSTIDAIAKLVNFQEDHEALKTNEELTKDEKAEDVKGVFASKKEYTLTSRDRLYLQLSRLPPLCHESVQSAFGGKTLQELSAAAIANRLRAEGIPVVKVEKAGYPEEVVELVKNLMGGHGVMRVDG